MQNISTSLKIGIVLSSVPGYSETFFRNKIKGLQADGFEVVLFVDYLQKTDSNFSCKIIAAPEFNGSKFQSTWNVIRMILAAMFLRPKQSYRLYQLDKNDRIPFKKRLKQLILNQFLLKEPLDWLHFGFGMLANGRENIAAVLNAKMAVSFRGYDLYLSPLKHPGCYDVLFSKDVHYHVLSQGMKATLKTYQIPEHAIQIITPAIDTEFFTSKNKPSFHNTSQLNMVTIARLHWKKGIEYTLEALAILKHHDIPFTYTIIGEGDQYERLVFAAHQLGISDTIRFLGKLSPSDVRDQLEHSNVYLQYSIQEGFCNAVLEAQSIGLLCLVSDAEGLDENVLDGVTGWVLPKRQPQLLAEKLIEVLQMSKERKQSISTTAIERVKNSFHLEQQRTLFRAFYRT